MQPGQTSYAYSYPTVQLTPYQGAPYQQEDQHQQEQHRHDQHRQEQQHRSTLSTSFAPQRSVPPAVESQILRGFNPFFDPEMLDVFPNGEIPDLSQYDTSPFSPDYFEIES